MASWSFAGDTAGRLASLAAIGIVIAASSPAIFAQYATLQATALLAAAAWDLGTSPLLTRLLAAGSIRPQSALRQIAKHRVRTIPLLLLALGIGLGALYQHRAPTVSVVAVLLCL